MILQFRRQYVALILDGAKTTTLRAKRPRGQGEPGELLHLFNGYRPGAKFAVARLRRMQQVRASALTAHQARADGFASLSALRRAIKDTYPGAEDLWLIEWEDVEPVARSGTPDPPTHKP